MINSNDENLTNDLVKAWASKRDLKISTQTFLTIRHQAEQMITGCRPWYCFPRAQLFPER